MPISNFFNFHNPGNNCILEQIIYCAILLNEIFDRNLQVLYNNERYIKIENLHRLF